MQTKKFIINTFLLISIVILLDIIGGKIFSSLQMKATEHSPYGMDIDYALNKVKTDIVIIGSSRACHHYDPKILMDSLNESIYNCGLNGEYFLCQTAMIDGILNRYSPKMIIWDFEPARSFQGTKEAMRHELDLLSDLFPFYHSDKYIHKLVQRRSDFESIKLLSSLYQYNSQLLHLISKSIKSDVNYCKGYVPLSTKGNSYPFIEASLFDKNRPLLNDWVTFFREIVARCKKQKTKLVISFSPRLAKDDYTCTKSYKTIITICKKNKILLLDHYHDKQFMSDSTLFKDNLHLNYLGSEKFTKLVASKIKSELKDNN